MLKVKNVRVYGLEESIIRSGYPMQVGEPETINEVIDEIMYVNPPRAKDYEVAKKLGKVKTGSGHDNFLKGVIIQFDLKYTQYFTKQLQRYNWIDYVSSQSQMHKLTSVKDIGTQCNEWVMQSVITEVNNLIDLYNSPTKEQDSNNCIEYPYHLSHTNLIFNSKQDIFQAIISNCPMGYELWTGVSTNYLQLKTIYFQRKNHKLEEWKVFCKWVEELPMFKQLLNL